MHRDSCGEGVKTKRPDAAELVEIRNGSRSYEELIEESEQLAVKCEELFLTSTLPDAPDPKTLNDLCITLHEEFWSRGDT